MYKSAPETDPERSKFATKRTPIYDLAMDRPAIVPELDVSDLDQSIDFYIGVLGFNVLFRRDQERFIYIEREGAHLMIEEADGPGRRFRTAKLQKPFGRGVNLQIRALDVATLYEAVMKAGLEPLIEMETNWYRQADIERGNRQFVVADPDGYLLRFYSDLGSRAVS